MEIKLPENPYLYLILVGTFFLVSAFVIVAVEGQRTLETFLILTIGVGSFAWGWTGLKKSHDLDQKKKRKEIELLDTKINFTDMTTLFGRS